MSFLIIAMALAAEPQAPPKPSDKKPRLICVEDTPLGSRLGGRRICKTAVEWDNDRHDMRDETERVQRLNTIHG